VVQKKQIEEQKLNELMAQLNCTPETQDQWVTDVKEWALRGTTTMLITTQ
jgi:hypothetical protein